MKTIILQKRGDKVRKALKALMTVLIVLILSAEVSASNTIEWYCKRDKNHNQPVLDKYLSQAEKYSDFIWVDKKHSNINDNKKVIYLTFDVGYENGNVEKILDVMKEENVKGTFFILQNVIDNNKDLLRKMIDDGHLIGNHTGKHKNMSKIADIESFRKELESLETSFREEMNTELSRYYRPPEGRFSIDNLEWARVLGYKTVMWSFAYADWDNDCQLSEDKAFDKIMENIHNGEVMLLHPTSSTNAKIIKRVIKELKNQGFVFARIDEI